MRTHVRRVAGGTAALAAAALAGAGPGAAVFVPQHGIGGVRVGQTEAAVRAIKGRQRQLLYRGLTVTLQGGRRVTAVSTRSPAERTPGGVGVGTSEARLVATVRGVRCRTFGGFRSCVLGVEEPGRRVTAFAIRRGAVRQVLIGIVID
jgi:hypothetical protein